MSKAIELIKRKFKILSSKELFGNNIVPLSYKEFLKRRKKVDIPIESYMDNRKEE